MKIASYSNSIITNRNNYASRGNIHLDPSPPPKLKNSLTLVLPNGIKPALTISFSGNCNKNMNQGASFAVEYQGILDPLYKAGGLGNVAGELPVSLYNHEGFDLRSFLPYYCADNAQGKIMIKRPLRESFEYATVEPDYNLKDGENFVSRHKIAKNDISETKELIAERVNLKGHIKAIKSDLSGVEDVPYNVFHVKETGSSTKPHVYIVHMPETAMFKKAYTLGGDKRQQAYLGNYLTDLAYTRNSRALIDILPNMNNKEFGFYNPGSFLLHDRQTFSCFLEIAEKSSKGDQYWRGIKVHGDYHNPGRAYQGVYTNPIDFFRLIGSEDDLKNLKKYADFNFIQQKIDKPISPQELIKLNKIFAPLLQDFIDEYGAYNMCKIPLVGISKNPYNFSAGTVSNYYGFEMKNHNTKEVAEGLTPYFASTKTIDIVNGSTSSNLNLNEIGEFGRKDENGFTEKIRKGFTPLSKTVLANDRGLYEAKQSNKKWLIDTIAGHEDDLSKLFFGESNTNGSTVLGKLSNYQEGDVLFVGWGRPDTQKGFPISLESFIEFFNNKGIDEGIKKKTKVLLGAGVWDDNMEDWKTIQKQMKKIAEIEDGKYAENVCFVNGFFSNRFVAAADYSIITSRYEPCGITPLESFSAGTPVLSNKTGGSPDYITPYVEGAGGDTKATGFLSKHSFYLNPEAVGLSEKATPEELDMARIKTLGKENAENIRQAVEIATNNVGAHQQMMKNCYELKIGWNENSNFNGGKTANQRYTEDAWNIIKDKDGIYREIPGLERNNEPLINIKGKLLDISENVTAPKVEKEALSFLSLIKENKKTSGAIALMTILGGAIYKIMKNCDKESNLYILSQKNNL